MPVNTVNHLYMLSVNTVNNLCMLSVNTVNNLCMLSVTIEFEIKEKQNISHF